MYFVSLNVIFGSLWCPEVSVSSCVLRFSDLPKAANIGLYDCSHFGRLELITQTGAETRTVVVAIVIIVIFTLLSAHPKLRCLDSCGPAVGENRLVHSGIGVGVDSGRRPAVCG